MSTEEMKEAIQEELSNEESTLGEEQESQNVDGDEGEHQLSDTEQRASQQGWVAKEDYSGNPDDWRGAKDFLEFGSLVKRVKQQNEQMKTMQSSFDDRLSNVNALHKGQLQSQMAQLNTQFAEAVDDRDTDKAESIKDQQASVNNQLRYLDREQQRTPENNDNAVKAQWELDNSWVNTNTDKALEAKGVYASALNVGKSIPEALEMVDNAVAKYNRSGNSNRAAPASVSSGRSSSRNQGGRSLSINDVSHQEMQMRGMFKDEKSFLKAVQDSRVGV